jgi:hypothetical protein
MTSKKTSKATTKKGGKEAQADRVPIMWRGMRLNAKTILMLQSAERRLGERMVITQGSFTVTTTSSAGTHDGAGVVDFSVRAPAPIEEMILVLREAGFAAWHRTPEQFPGDTVPEHIHAVSLFDECLAPTAAVQKAAYLADPPLNGLSNSGADNGPRVRLPTKPPLVKQTVRPQEILFGQTNDSVGYLQDVLGLTTDRFFGPVTRSFVKKEFGWNGIEPMDDKLFKKLFPVSVFIRGETVADG